MSAPIQSLLINGRWTTSRSPIGTFAAVNPAAQQTLEEVYPISGFEDIDASLSAAQTAVKKMRGIPPVKIAAFLEAFADKIEMLSDILVETASLETALPVEPRLRSVELPRTINQLSQAALAVHDRSWRRATIDTNYNIRSMYGSLGGAVVIFGPNNFPFAFNPAAGGDFAAAIAAGNPVIAKANPGHPGTTRIFAEAALECLEASGLPTETVQLLYHFQSKDGLKLAAHPSIGAIAFTGSRDSGLKLKDAADHAGNLIYLEMSSINPVIILPGALKERLKEIAEELFNSCTLSTGQFCTKPGLVLLVKCKKSEKFLEQTSKHFNQATKGFLLNERAVSQIKNGTGSMQAAGAELVCGGEPIRGPGYQFSNTLLRTSGENFLRKPEVFLKEVFGPIVLIVFANDQEQFLEITGQLEGSLTGSIYSETTGEDERLYKQIEPLLRQKSGRMLNDKMPTGVAVSTAMNHGGPFPATGHPGFTAVGIPASLLRFTSLQCYDNVRPHRLPDELKDKNPTGLMWRLIDGEWTQKDV